MRLLLAIAIFMFVMSTGSAATVEDRALWLARAIELSSQGEISDETVIKELKSLIFDQSLTMATRLEAAYLFTFVTSGQSSEIDETRNKAVDFALHSPDLDTLLSKDAVTRLYRLKGDHKFDTAKFTDAIGAYSEVLKRLSPTDARVDYAIARKGWSYLNQDKPALAFDLWLKETRFRLDHNVSLSSSLLHGLGQAYSENGKRTQNDGKAIANLPLNPDQRETFSKGLVDGVNYLKTRGEIERWWNDLSVLTWRDSMANTIEESSYATGRRACELLPLATHSRNSSGLGAHNIRLVENCAEAYLKKDPEARKSSAALKEIFARFDLKGQQRRLRYMVYRADLQFLQACREGIHWVGDEEGVETPTLPLKNLIEVCQSVVGPNASTEIANEILSLHSRAEKTFRIANDPALYLMNSMLKASAMANAVSTQMLKASANFKGTLLPQMVTEALVKNQNFEQAESMRVTFQDPSSPLGNSTLWGELKLRRFRSLVEARKLQDARLFLNRECPLTLNNSDDCEAGWLWLVSKEVSDPVHKEDAKVTVTKALTGEVSVRQMSRWLNLGVQLGFTDLLLVGVKRLEPATESGPELDRVKLILFDAIASGEMKLGPDELRMIRDPGVSEVVSFAEVVRDNTAAKIADSKLKTSTTLSSDLKALKSVDDKARVALRKKKEPVDELSAWVDFLNTNSRGIGKRKWVSRVMYARGVESVEAFCGYATKRLAEISPSAQISREEWVEMVRLLEERLAQCRAWVEKSKGTDG